MERSGETGNPVSLDDIGLAHDGYHDYEPSGWLSLRRALHGVEIGRSQAFLDIGCVPDDVTLAYMCNALAGSALTAMLDRLAESVDRAPRQLLLLHANPVHEAALLAHPKLELHEQRGRRRWSATDPRRISVFRILG